MRKNLAIIMMSLLITGLSASSSHSGYISTFNSGTEGWTVVGADGPTWISTGGNPGGYIQGIDSSTSSRWSFVSPDSWDGAWTSYIGSSLQFDLLKTGATGTETVWNVVIYSGTNYAVLDTAITPTLNVWGHYAFDLTSANFDRIIGTLSFTQIMSNVTALYILGDYGGNDTGGLDNVQINGVPEPATMLLLGLGLVGLAGARRIKK